MQPPKKPNRAPFAAATCLPAVRKALSKPILLEDDLKQYPGESTFQTVDPLEQLQPVLTDQLPVQTQLEVPLVTPEVPFMAPQLPTESVAPAGSCEAETTAVPKVKELSISAQPSADHALAVVPYAGPSSCAAVLEVRGYSAPDWQPMRCSIYVQYIVAVTLFSAHQVLVCCIDTCNGQLAEHVMPQRFEDPLCNATGVAQTAISQQFLQCCRH